MSGQVFFAVVAVLSGANSARPFLATPDGAALSQTAMLRRTARLPRALDVPPGGRMASCPSAC